MSKPHIVVIMADQLRYDALGAHTPHLSALAAQSVTLDRAYCASPLCLPARGAFFTGRYPSATGCLINPWEPSEQRHGHVRAGTPSLYSLLEGDWDSWHTGKQHLLLEDRPDKRDDARTHWLSLAGNYDRHLREHGKRKPGGPAFQGIVPEMARGTRTRAMRYSIPMTGIYEEGFAHFFDGYIANRTIEALRDRDTSKPLLLNAMFVAPHPPLEVPEPWYSRVREARLPDNVGVWAEGQSPLQLYNLPGFVGSRYTREDWARIWPVYLGLVSLLDDCVGMIIEELKRQGIYDETLIVFTSDHGEMLGSHGLWQKMCMYEESVRTPLWFKFPASAGLAPRRVAQPASAIDVLPTICDYAGVPAPAGLDGHSLMPLLRGEPAEARDIFIQYDGNGARGNFQRCILDERYKLIVDLFKDELYIELYDASGGDPQEMTNLSLEPDKGPIIELMLAELREHMAATGDLLHLPEAAYETFVQRYGA
ncbi:sulfatase-like hydrolase/transferase [Paenibacillus sp. IB182496]|uniref:Sulfatase-like hydrolase/transferase n=1 Tax=Paenibacillus sabuli TaxID=2772509 RepID=A0A927BTE3_9BACL|nr:sulfatase-like hydrolase/transferase [Paenibacillus sabuli]MBD2845947.1 sulfatase-like hydrolase/transferase [Paenibacillus sabuli]